MSTSDRWCVARVGSGKTAATATAVYTLQQWGYVRAALIFGTRRIVQQVWGPECAKWSHLRHMRVAVLRGKHRDYLLQQQADLYVINYEAIPWLITQLHHTYVRHNRPLPFDMAILDEVTKVKNAQGKRWGYLYEGLMPAIPRRVGLTGTPAPNGYLDLHGQYRMLDDGQRLGTSKEHYRDHFFTPQGYGGYKYVPRTGARDQIHNLIGDITAHVHVPRRTAEPLVNDIMVQLEPQHRKQYEDLEKELFAELDGGEKLEVFNQAALSNKCLQLANGSAITNTETRQWAPVHDAKLEALDDLLEEIGGRPLLLAYNFRSDMHRIVDRYKGKLAVAYLGPGVSDADGVDIENRWNNGEYNLLVGHSASIGHGLNLQYGGHEICWFGLTWNLELYDQLIGRLDDRHGQTEQVIVHRILADDTIDLVVREALRDKIHDQEGLKHAITEYRNRKKVGAPQV